MILCTYPVAGVAGDAELVEDGGEVVVGDAAELLDHVVGQALIGHVNRAHRSRGGTQRRRLSH